MVDGAQGRCISPRMFSNWILISMLFQVTNCMVRQASACCIAETRTAGSDVAWLGGGKMVHEVSFDGFTTQSAPWKLEAGTPNVAGVIGLSAALEWLTDYDINQAESWSRSLATLAEEALAKRPKLFIPLP